MVGKNTVKVMLDGKIITLVGYETEEYLQRVANYINHKIEELGQIPTYRRLPLETRGALLALNIADDYFKAKSQVDEFEEEVENKDKEAYDIKQDLVAAQMEIERLKQELKRTAR